MKRLLLATFLVPALALGAHHDKAHSDKAHSDKAHSDKAHSAAAPSASAEDPMAGWVPPKVKNEAKDKQEIQALFKAMETAAKKGDLDAAASLVDFPVMMMTDDSKGEAMGEAWEREKWTEVMKPFYGSPMKDMKVTHKPTIFLLSDSLASVDDVCTMTMGGKTVTSRNSMFVVRKDGKWLVKAMAEGGWGDMMAAAPTTAGGASESGSQGTGSAAESGSQGSGMGSGSQGSGMGSGSQGSGTAAEPPSSGTGSGATGTGSQGSGAAADPQGGATVSEPPGSTGAGSGSQGSTPTTR